MQWREVVSEPVELNQIHSAPLHFRCSSVARRCWKKPWRAGDSSGLASSRFVFSDRAYWASWRKGKVMAPRLRPPKAAWDVTGLRMVEASSWRVYLRILCQGPYGDFDVQPRCRSWGALDRSSNWWSNGTAFSLEAGTRLLGRIVAIALNWLEQIMFRSKVDRIFAASVLPEISNTRPFAVSVTPRTSA